MKEQIKNRLIKAVQKASESFGMTEFSDSKFDIEVPRVEAHGDFSTNAAMVSASAFKMSPRKIAEAIVRNFDNSDGFFDKIEIAGPGFINFFISIRSWYPVLKQIHEQDTGYGSSNIGKGQKVQVEYVSVNPTGPLHIGHGRCAAVGDCVANVLRFCGYDVQREYYINDSGRQIRTLGLSVSLRLQELDGKKIVFPEDTYPGEYVIDIAKEIKTKYGRKIFDMEESEALMICARYAVEKILGMIRNDLNDFGVSFDLWYSEQSLYDAGKVDQALKEFREKGLIYETDGALWFKTSEFGDEKDRVVVKQDGLTTYFASDIAYHQEKYQRGFERVIDVWGADHHGYIPRMTAAILASGQQKKQFQVVLVHLVNLLRGGQPVAMGKRSGDYVTLKDVVDEVGKDAARFIFLTRHYESPLDFDLEIAKKKSDDNPVFYVQYVHARICSIISKREEKGIDRPHDEWHEAAISKLTEYEEIKLLKLLEGYPAVIAESAEFLEPHRITYYLMNLAASFHAYYNKHKVLSEDPDLSQGRLYLITAVQKVIRNGLSLLGVSAPEKM